MSQQEIKLFHHKLAQHSAPSLLGIKCASLISLSKKEFDIPAHARIFNRRAAKKGLKIRLLSERDGRVLILVYNESMLAQRLSEEDRQQILEHFGYNDTDVDVCLDRLSQRIQQGDGFPHEIGLFLDYPVEDVVGFIENHGDNFKLCGYWKVYGNAEFAERRFSNFDKCRRFLYSKLAGGEDIYGALRI